MADQPGVGIGLFLAREIIQAQKGYIKVTSKRGKGYAWHTAIGLQAVDGLNDFTGKTVIPFCTAATSGIGDSGNLLEEMTGTGDWKEGERFHGGASESDISSWIDSLGL